MIQDSRELKFLTTMDIEVTSGNILLIQETDSTTPRKIDLGTDLNGKPVILGQKIEMSLPGNQLNIEYYNGAELNMNGPSFYESFDLGDTSNSYTVALRQENSWYYAKLEAISPNRRTSSRITLLSPQAEADKEAPLIQSGGGFRAPVYLEQKIDLRDMISDISGISDIYIDTDLTKDTDNDGKLDNDRDSESASGMLRPGSSILEWFIKPQDRIFEQKIKIWAEDENKNLAGRESKIIIYAPVPNISSQSGTTIKGYLDESLSNEPVDIVRFRNGKISPVGDVGLTGSDGTFDQTIATGSGVVVR